jgi:hypothetical protein
MESQSWIVEYWKLQGGQAESGARPYAGVTSTGYEACAQHPLRFYVRMRKTPCTQMAADQGMDQGTAMHDIHTRIT